MNGDNVQDKAFIDGVFGKYENAYTAFSNILIAKGDNIDNYNVKSITSHCIVFENSYRYLYWIKEFEIY
jgi:hypothetical protein